MDRKQLAQRDLPILAEDVSGVEISGVNLSHRLSAAASRWQDTVA